MKARTRRDHLMVLGKMGKAPTLRRPLVEIAHYDSRQGLIENVELVEHRLGLPAPPKVDETEMQPDDA